jgi:hypothetical protein
MAKQKARRLTILQGHQEPPNQGFQDSVIQLPHDALAPHPQRR